MQPVTRCFSSIGLKMVIKVLILFCILSGIALASDNTRYVDISEFPYHVSIEVDGKHICSGALLHELWVITVASCVFRLDPDTVAVRIRSSKLSCGDEEKVAEIVIHEDFDKSLLLSNIALIKLKYPVLYGEKLLPIVLPEKENYTLDDGTTCYVTGWRHNVVGEVESRLTVTAVPLVNQTTCSSMMPCDEPVFQSMLCAGNMTYGVDTCQGDLGAALMEGQMLIGVLSHGLGCKTMIHPGVYTRVSSYLAWIALVSGLH